MTRRVIDAASAEWPPRLRELTPGLRPPRLHVEGRPLQVGTRGIAVVGSRRPSAAGVQTAVEIARGLAEAGLPVVSGLAMGIDAAAHQAALDAGGYTVAVLGCGLDVDYPRRNARLRRRIAECGSLVTEYDPGVEPRPEHFPMRNRIIAGMSHGVVFVEGSERSGGLITARLALEANRHVFAVPGSTRNPLAAGPNELIRTSQASLVTGAQQILEEIAPGLVWGEADVGEPDLGAPLVNAVEAKVLLFLDDVPVSVDRICSGLGLSFGEVAIALAALEVRNYVAKSVRGYGVTTAGARVRTRLPVEDGEQVP